MSLSGWLVAGAIFIVIIFIALGIGWWIRNNSHPTPTPPNPYIAPFVWAPPVPSANPAKNTCKLYTFPTAVLNIDGYTGTAVPGTPTFNSEVLDNLQGVPRYPRCLDTDQIMAQQVTHTCHAPNGVVEESITRCFLLSGGTTGLGGTETYYTNSNCSKVTSCPGQLSLVSINFQAPTQPNIRCLQNEGTGGTITMQPCDPSNPRQLFRVTRINPGQNPNSLQPGQGQNGLLAQILDRNTGLCVVPGNATTSTIYDPSYLTPVSSTCTGPQQTFIGTNVILGPCTGGTGFAPGYVWVLLPSLPYCPIVGSSCTGCTGCTGCSRIPGSNNCTGCAGCGGNAALPTPPQIVYAGNLNFADAPTGMTAYQGLTGPSAIFKWLEDNSAQSLYYGGAGSGLILTDLGTDVDVCKERPYMSQYLNLTTYNTIISEEVCLAEKTLGTPNCIGF